MSKDYPDAQPQHEDGARILQPFSFTTGGPGDFRPTRASAEVAEQKAPEVPKAPEESATVPAASQTQDPTDDEFAQQLKSAEAAAAELTSELEKDQKSESADQSQTDAKSESPASPAPSLAGKAKQKDSTKTSDDSSSQTSS